MTSDKEDGIDWSLTTWKGSRRQQHQQFLALPFRRKLELIEEMVEHGRSMIESRKARGLPYIDPDTGAPVPGTPKP